MLLGFEPGEVVQGCVWFSRIWPIIGPFVFLLVFKRRIHHPIAFYVFGALVCFGADAVIGLAGIRHREMQGAEGLSDYAFDSPAELEAVRAQLLLEYAASIVYHAIVVFVISLALLLWLVRLLMHRVPNDNGMKGK